MDVVVVDYGMGNLRSVHKALERVGCNASISSDPAAISTASRLVLPGVGHFAKGMANLDSRGLLGVLNQRVLEAQVPVLGICLGLQLMSRHSEEGDCNGLGWIDADTVKFDFSTSSKPLRVPHIGWNTLNVDSGSSLLSTVAGHDSFYFTHSFHLARCAAEIRAATTTYGESFVSAIQAGNLFGTQFHPEKSHKRGLDLLRRFVEAD
ncbi:MAG: imidazole glycerol phosphate synthase subunit HisH [Deltaproteobacteria bacterium]|nr:imidazole glycerol phosphate synthase subunit HisH [Deltaproteobacteria bacterium]